MSSSITAKPSMIDSLPHVEFYDLASRRYMRYIRPHARTWMAGWLLYQASYNRWVTLRMATPTDVARILVAQEKAQRSQERSLLRLSIENES